MSKYWFDYVKSCYDLVVESEGNTSLILEHEVEAYVVHMMARNFNRVNIGDNPVALQLLTAVNSNRTENIVAVADECLLIHSYPLKSHRWPTSTYFQEMGITAYGLAGHMMEQHFIVASRVLSAIFNRQFDAVSLRSS